MINACGRMYVTNLINDNKVTKNYYIDQVIANRYLPDKSHPKAYVNHIDNNLNNNKIENLRWDNPSYVCIIQDYVNEVEECDSDPCADIDDDIENIDEDIKIIHNLFDMKIISDETIGIKTGLFNNLDDNRNIL